MGKEMKFLFTGLIMTALLMTALPALSFEAYIDDDSGLVVARGEAVRTEGENIDSVRQRARNAARSNLLMLIERQYIDVDSTTVGDYLTDHPDKRPILDRYLNTASVFAEIEEKGVLKLTLVAPYFGIDGYQAMIAEIQGKEPPDFRIEGGASDPEIMGELQETFGGREPGNMGQPFHIAMLPFENASDYINQDIGAIFSERLRALFQKDRRFILMDEDDSVSLLIENGLSITDVVDSDVTDTLSISGADGVVVGSVLNYKPFVKKHGIGGTGYLEMNFAMDLELRILNTESGRWVFHEIIPIMISERTFTLKSADDAEKFIAVDDVDSDRGLAARAFRNMLNKADTAIRASFPLEGYVLKVISDWVYINLRRIDGIKEGDVLTVYRVGELLKDPITGEVISRIRDRIGTIKVLDVKDDYTQAKAEDLFGEKIMPGDIVLLK